MANQNIDIIRVEALAAALQATLIPGQLGFATDTNQLGHLRKDGITMDWWDSNESSWLIWDATGQGGVTTTSPQAKLDIHTSGDDKLALTDPDNSAENNIITKYIAGGIDKFDVGFYYPTVGSQHWSVIPNGLTSGLSVSYAGYVGIFDKAPYKPLTVNGEAAINNTLWLTSLTPGSVTFIGAGSSNYEALTEDNDKFFWDEENFRLGLGNNSPNEQLEVTGNIRNSALTASRVVGTDTFKNLTSVEPSAGYTQTAYATLTRTVTNLTSATLTDSSGGSKDNTVSSTDDSVANDNFAEVTEEINALRVDLINIKQVLNAVIDDLQERNLLA